MSSKSIQKVSEKSFVWNNLLFALKLSFNEMNECKIKNSEEFQLITKIVLNNFNFSNWHQNCWENNGNLLNPINVHNLNTEMEKSKQDL
jgi:hypothetical protein